jgi:LAO/AO transport system kinase
LPSKIDPLDLVKRVRRGEHAAASRSLSIVVNDEKDSELLAKEFFKASGSAQKIGVSGPPGVGKSTLTGRLIGYYRSKKLKVGVLMVDPSSSISGGAFLGDRLRVMEHATDSGVFIRSLASRGMIGGLTYAIFGAIHVLETLGCDKILIETVGTGQDEVEIASVADTVLYVTTPSMGDEIQAMKAGAMEIGDIFVVNKADLAGKDKAVADLKAALGLGHSAGQAVKAWEPPVLASSAKSGEGIPELAKELDGHWKHLQGSGEGRARLKRQHATELQFWIQRRVMKSALDRVTDKILEDMVSRKTDPATIGRKLLKI